MLLTARRKCRNYIGFENYCIDFLGNWESTGNTFSFVTPVRHTPMKFGQLTYRKFFFCRTLCKLKSKFLVFARVIYSSMLILMVYKYGVPIVLYTYILVCTYRVIQISTNHRKREFGASKFHSPFNIRQSHS